MLASRQPMCVWWGEMLVNLYNDPCRSMLGIEHPEALARPASSVWSEIWSELSRHIPTVTHEGEGACTDSLPLVIDCGGYREESFFSFSLSPISDDSGGAGGILCVIADDTQRIVNDRELALLRDLATRTTSARTWTKAGRLGVEAIRTSPRDLPFALIYLVASRDAGHGRVVLAGTAGIEPGGPLSPEAISLDTDTFWPITEVLNTRVSRLVGDLSDLEDVSPAGFSAQPARQAIALPITPIGQAGRAGVLIVGLNPLRGFDDNYQGFLDLVVGQISTAVANADAFEEETRRTEALDDAADRASGRGGAVRHAGNVQAGVVSVLESMPDGFAAFDRDWNIVYVNAAAERLAGASRDDLLQRNLWTRYPGGVAASVAESLNRAMQERESVTFEVSNADRSLWVEVNAQPVADGGISIYLHDITDRKQAESEVLALRNELAADLLAMVRLHDLSTQLIVQSELKPLLEDILSAAMELQGADFGTVQLYDPATDTIEIMAQFGFEAEVLQYFTARNDERSASGRALRERRRAIIEDVNEDAEYAPHRRIAATGGFRAIQSTPLFRRDGGLLGLLTIYFRQPHRPSERELRLTDLYARQAGEMIERSQIGATLAYQANLLEMASDAIIASDVESRITFWNPRAERLYGWSADEVLGEQSTISSSPLEIPTGRANAMHGCLACAMEVWYRASTRDGAKTAR